MTEENCQAIRDLLVDYADGEVSRADAQRVAGHLETCLDCRTELRLLEQSLELAQAVWQESARATTGTVEVAVERPTQRGSIQRWQRRWALAALAATVIVALLTLPWLLPHAGPARIAQQAPNPKTPATGGSRSPESATMGEEEIERYLAREAAAARLRAAAELLATQPGLEEHRQRAERYIIETYGDTEAGRELSARTAPKPTKEPQS